MANDWKLEGQYFESCNCDLVCPCIFLRPPTQGFCKAIVGWQIEKGYMDDVDLSGLNVGLWLYAPGLMTEGGWQVTLYIDERADAQQAEALQKIWGGAVGGHPAVIAGLVGEIKGVHSAKVDITYTDKEKIMKISDYGEVKVNALEGAEGKQVLVENHPLAIAPGFAATVHQSEYINSSHNEEFQCAETVGLASSFVYQPN